MQARSKNWPYPRIARYLALLFLLISAAALVSNISHPRQMDFASFWAAAVLALNGQAAAAYDVALHQAVQNQAGPFGNLLAFAYPPPFLFPLLAFGLLPYGIAALLWVAACFAFYSVASRRIWPGSGWHSSAFPPVLGNCLIGQSGLLTGAIFLAAAGQLISRPFISGLLFGCLIIKPQLGVLLPIALLSGGHLRAFAGAALSATALLLGALLIFGIGTYQTMLEALPAYSDLAFGSTLGWQKMVSIYAALRLAGASAAAAWTVHIVVAAGATILTAVLWRRAGDINIKLAVLAAATALISPYLFLYDLVLLILPFMVLLRSGRPPYLLAMLWCLPLLHLAKSWDFLPDLNLMPLLPLALLALLAPETHRHAPQLPSGT